MLLGSREHQGTNLAWGHLDWLDPVGRTISVPLRLAVSLPPSLFLTLAFSPVFPPPLPFLPTPVLVSSNCYDKLPHT